MDANGKNIGALVIGVVIFAGTLFIGAWAISKGWESGQK